jgi:hypothetical protein
MFTSKGLHPCWSSNDTSLNPVPNAQVYVYLTVYITKLHFQNLSIYYILHIFMGTLATENFDVCTTCDPWDSNIQLTMLKDQRQQIYPKCHSNRKLTTILISKSWGCPPLGLGMPFLDSNTCTKGGGGFIYFCQGFFSLYDGIHGWMTGQMDGWKKLHEKQPRRPLLYVNSPHSWVTKCVVTLCMGLKQFD